MHAEEAGQFAREGATAEIGDVMENEGRQLEAADDLLAAASWRCSTKRSHVFGHALCKWLGWGFHVLFGMVGYPRPGIPALFKRVVTLSTTLAVSVLVAACADSNDAGSASPLFTPDVVTSEVAESQQVNDEGVFLRVIAPLDETRGYCLDIPGHLSSVQIESPLQVHTCKHGIWNQDGRFEAAALRIGVLRMPHYELCVQAENTSIGARLLLAECTETALQTWTLRDSGQIVLKGFAQVCITVEEGPSRDAGGPRYRMNGVGLDTCAQNAIDRQRWTTVKPR